MTEMNVFIYEGTDRTNASIPITYHNKQPVVNETYGVDVNSGIVIVAYPNAN
jgi:hypothetical protein